MVATIIALTLIALALFLSRDRAPVVGQAASPRDGVSAAPLAALRTDPPTPTPAIGIDETLMCGYGPVKQTAVLDIESDALATAEKTLSRLAVKLAASRNERDTALGLFLGRSMRSRDAVNDYHREHPDCENDPSCSQSMTALGSGHEATIRDTLVRMASASRDSQVYALALNSCGGVFGNRAEGACTLLSAERWAELDPDNGVPWLYLAGAAQAAHDLAGRDQAVYHASTAQRFDAGVPSLLGLLQSLDIRAEAPQTRAAVADELLAVEGTLPLPSYGPFLQFCNYPSVADATRIGVCGDLANLLLERDRTLMGLSMGAKLAQSANWPEQVVDALRDEKDAVFQAAQKAAWVSDLGTDCQHLARYERWVLDNAQLGRLGATRKFMVEAGKTAAHSGMASGNQRFANR